MTQNQGNIEATKDTVKGLNKELEPVEVIKAGFMLSLFTPYI